MTFLSKDYSHTTAEIILKGLWYELYYHCPKFILPDYIKHPYLAAVSFANCGENQTIYTEYNKFEDLIATFETQVNCLDDRNIEFHVSLVALNVCKFMAECKQHGVDKDFYRFLYTDTRGGLPKVMPMLKTFRKEEILNK